MRGDLEDNRSFWNHLEEFRRRLIVIIAVWVLGIFVCFPFSHAVIRYISRPVGQLIFLSPSEAFSVRFQVTLILSAAAVFPVWIYHIMRFLYDGLKKIERKMFLWCVVFVAGFSFFGGIFSDRILIPISVKFLLGFAGSSLEPMLTAHNYLSFYFGMLIFCCLLFNLPFIIIWLVWQGAVSEEWLRRYRRHFYIACFVLSAVVTPPDVLTQLIMALPLCFLYEFSLIGVKIFVGKGGR